MKSIFLSTILLLSPLALATEIGDSYTNVTKVSCSGTEGEITMNVESQELTGQFKANGRAMELSFAPLKGQSPEYQVGVMQDFLGSGYDVLGSVVMAVEVESFGTYGLVLDKKLTNPDSQEMTVFYMEAMTGWQADMLMTCSFSK